MFRRLLALAFVLCSAVQPAGAADASKPLRVLVYDVNYTTTTLRREHTSGFTEGGTSVTTSGIVDRRFGGDDAGTLTVAIVAATQDGGLVADVTFSGKEKSQPVVRVAILQDGRLSYDPRLSLSGPAIALLPFLARGLVAERDVNPDSSWTIQAKAPSTGTTTYKVVSLDADVATIDVTSTVSVRGRDAYAESVTGRTAYAVDKLSPLSLELNGTTRRDVNMGESETTEIHLSAKLHSDSFAKR